MSETLFEKYGGFDTFSAVVRCFYTKILDSDELEPYFSDIDMDRLMSHQTNFISKALGGPDRYEGRDLQLVHANLHITLPHFQEVAELLGEALEEAGVEEPDVETIIAVVAGLQEQIVNPTPH